MVKLDTNLELIICGKWCLVCL